MPDSVNKTVNKNALLLSNWQSVCLVEAMGVVAEAGAGWVGSEDPEKLKGS